MITQPLLHNIARLAFLGSSAALALTFMELIAHLFGASLIGNVYSLGRLLDLAATLMLFAIAIWVREIRDGARKPGSS